MSEQIDRVTHVEVLKAEIIKHVQDNSSFTVDDGCWQSVVFITRENGDVGNEEPGAQDILTARKLKDELYAKHGKAALNISIDTCDEWVYLEVLILVEVQNDDRHR